MEEDGFIKLVSRIKELIITGGFNVYPAEVEEVMRKHRDVVDVAVVGRPREDGSEDVVACVVLRDGAALDPELSLIHISEPTRLSLVSRMPSSA